jgi:hypothetical protein
MNDFREGVIHTKRHQQLQNELAVSARDQVWFLFFLFNIEINHSFIQTQNKFNHSKHLFLYNNIYIILHISYNIFKEIDVNNFSLSFSFCQVTQEPNVLNLTKHNWNCDFFVQTKLIETFHCYILAFFWLIYGKIYGNVTKLKFVNKNIFHLNSFSFCCVDK